MDANRKAIADAAKGWLYEEEAEHLHKLATGCTTVVEIGAYCGKSTIWLGDAVEPTGFVFSVDPHRGNPEMAPGMSCYDAEVMDGDRVDTFPMWRSNIDDAELAGCVIPVVTPSHVFAQALDMVPDLVFIDGNHDEGAIEDAADWCHAKVVAVHDTSIPTIQQACQVLLDSGKKMVAAIYSMKVYQ